MVGTRSEAPSTTPCTVIHRTRACARHRAAAQSHPARYPLPLAESRSIPEPSASLRPGNASSALVMPSAALPLGKCRMKDRSFGVRPRVRLSAGAEHFTWYHTGLHRGRVRPWQADASGCRRCRENSRTCHPVVSRVAARCAGATTANPVGGCDRLATCQ